MSVVVACRAADGAIVFGADQLVTSPDERREMTKLSFFPFVGGKALIGMAASEVNLAFSRKVSLFQALQALDTDEDPVVGVRRCC